MNQKLEKLSTIFDIWYGINLELNKLEQCEKSDPEAINFVSRSDRNNGISAVVKQKKGLTPNPAYTISVAGGGSVLASFLQTEPYYSGRDVYILMPKKKMAEFEMLFYCYCIRKNRYRYNYGRQANKTLRDILVPGEIPSWVKNRSQNIIPIEDKPYQSKNLSLHTHKWKLFKYSDLFEIDRGRGPRLKDLTTSGSCPFVTATNQNNGWSGLTENKPFHEGNVISVARNGNSVAEAFYQPKPFCSTEDVHIFTPKFTLNPYIALFFTTLIRKEKYRYSYGRKWGLLRMNETYIKLPSKNGTPDFEYMEQYIKSLPYSATI